MANKKWKTLLPTRYVSSLIFNQMLQKTRVKNVDNFEDYRYGIINENKRRIIIRDNENPDRIVCLLQFEEFCYPKKYWSNEGDWKQFIYQVNNAQAEVLEPFSYNKKRNLNNISITGTYATNYLNKIIRKYYSEEEILNNYEANSKEYNFDYAQQHYVVKDPETIGKIRKYPNCYYYDINGAHTDALVELFPRCKDVFIDMYKRRKEHPEIKQIFNFFVGNLRHSHEGTYNWIVQRTTKKLTEFKDYIGGKAVYINTDGIVVQNPINTPANSTELGDFKLEYVGDVYLYSRSSPSPYWIMQIGKDLKGICPLEYRSMIDLPNGKVISYKCTVVKREDSDSGAKVYKDINVENVEIVSVEQ